MTTTATMPQDWILVTHGKKIGDAVQGGTRTTKFQMDVPISIGVLIATALSLYETATHGPHAYFDGVVMLLFFLLCGRWLDSVMRDRARGGVTALLRNMGTGAMVVGAEETSR